MNPSRGTKTGPSARPGADNEGVALILALLFIVLLTALVVEFSYEIQVEASHAENSGQNIEAMIAAKSAVHAGLALLAADLFVPPEAGGLAGGGPDYDSLDEEWAGGIPLAPINESIMQCTIQDEYGKINLNALLVDSKREEPNEILVEALRVLFDNREMEHNPVDAILDWVDDDDDEQGVTGAEEDYYTSLEIPYRPKNGKMESIEELLLIPGITVEAYYGDPELDMLPLYELLTVHGEPDGLINANTAALEVMQAVIQAAELPAVAYDNWAQRIEQGTPYATRDELVQDELIIEPRQNDRRSNPPPQRREPVAPFIITGDVYRLRGDGLAGETQVRVEAYVWRDRELVEPELFRILDWRVLQ